MKKIFFLGLFLLISTQAWAGYEEYYVGPKTDTPFKVFGRGVINFVGLPLEVPVSGIQEYQMHPYVWPVTCIPRMLSNVIYRTASATNDTLVLPWYAPFTKDTSPWTKGIGLPNYPWNVNP